MTIVTSCDLDDDWKHVGAEETKFDGNGILLLNEKDDCNSLSSVTSFPFTPHRDRSEPSPKGIQFDHRVSQQLLHLSSSGGEEYAKVDHDQRTRYPDETTGLKRESRPYKGRKWRRENTEVENSAAINVQKISEQIAANSNQQRIMEACGAINSYLDILLNVDEVVAEDDIRKVMRLLRREVSSLEPENGEVALRYALAILYKATEEKPEDDFTIERAVYLIGNLASKEIWASNAIADTGGAERLVGIMTKHHGSVRIQERAVSTLLKMTSSAQARSAIVSAKGAESICWAMKGFLNTRKIQVEGSTALCNLAFASADNKKRLGKIGGIDAVVKAMDSHKSDADIQARCCLALRNLTCGNRVNQWIAGRACAIEAIVRAMDRFQDDANMQYQGCVALANLSQDEPENRSRAAETGVVEATLLALRTYTIHAELVEHGLILLFNLAQGGTEFRENIGERDGISVIIKCFREHLGSPAILETGCKVLRYLLFVQKNRMAIYNCGGLEIMVRVLREGAKSKAVAESAIYALGNSAYDYPESKRAVGRYGGMAALVDVMSQHMDSADVQEHGCRALRNLADSDDLSGRLLAESGAIDSCIFACTGYPNNARIQEHACAMLFNMAYSKANIRRMKGLDVERVVDQARENHGDDQAVLSQVVALQESLKFNSRAPFRKTSNMTRGSRSSLNLGALTRKGSGLLHGPNSARRRSSRPGLSPDRSGNGSEQYSGEQSLR